MKSEESFVPYTVGPFPEGPWVVFAARPDDETFGMGGSLLLANQQGIMVVLVIVTDGSQGGQDPEISTIRQNEAVLAARALGIEQVFFWKEPDRDLEVSDRLIRRVSSLIDSEQPKSVFFSSCWEPHPDHRAVSLLVQKGLNQCEYRKFQMFSYEIGVQGQVNLLLDISSVMPQKKEVMRLYESQLRENNYFDVAVALNKARTFSLHPDVLYAEGFWSFGPAGVRNIFSKAGEPKSQYARRHELEKAPRVSVLIRTKNRPRVLREALQSVVDQTYPLIELLVVNDNGVSVQAIVDECGSLVDDFKYISLSKGLGRAGAANCLLDNATGEFCLFLDDDDLIAPDHIENLVEKMKKSPDVRAAYAGVYVEGAEGLKVIHHIPYDPFLLCIDNSFPIHSVLFCRSLVREGCRFDERFSVYEDWDFWLQVAEKTVFVAEEKVTATYRKEGSSAVGFAAPDMNKVQEARCAIYEKWRYLWSGEKINGIIEAIRQKQVDDRAHAVHVEKQKTNYWQQKCQALEDSTTWKLSAPFRFVMHRLKKK